MSWNIWIMNEQITISAFRCMSSNIWTLNIWIINERITISASQIEADFRTKKLKLLLSKVQKYPQKNPPKNSMWLFMLCILRLDWYSHWLQDSTSWGVNCYILCLSGVENPQILFKNFLPLTPQCRQLPGERQEGVRGCRSCKNVFAKIASDAPTTLPWWSPAILGAS